MSRVRLVHVLSENWTLTPPRDLRALGADGAGGGGRGLRRGDGERARRARPGRRRRRADAEPARLRASREPRPGDALAELARPPLGDRLRDDDAPARRGGDHRAAPASAAAREGPRDARPALGGPPRRPAHRQLARAGVRRARCPLRRPRRAARRAPRRLAGRLGTVTRVVRGRPLPFERCVGRAEALPCRWRAPLVRLEHVHDRLLRRLVRYGHGWNPLGRPTDEDVARLRGRSPRQGAISASSSSSAALADVSPTPAPRRTWARRSRRFPSRSSAASRRSASSPRSSSTIRPGTRRGAGRSSPGWAPMLDSVRRTRSGAAGRPPRSR